MRRLVGRAVGRYEVMTEAAWTIVMWCGMVSVMSWTGFAMFLTFSLESLECFCLFRSQDLFHFFPVFLSHFFHGSPVFRPHFLYLCPVFFIGFLSFGSLSGKKFFKFCRLLFRKIQFP